MLSGDVERMPPAHFPVIVCQTLKNRAALLAKYTVLTEVSSLVFCTTSNFKNLKNTNSFKYNAKTYSYSVFLSLKAKINTVSTMKRDADFIL